MLTHRLLRGTGCDFSSGAFAAYYSDAADRRRNTGEAPGRHEAPTGHHGSWTWPGDTPHAHLDVSACTRTLVPWLSDVTVQTFSWQEKNDQNLLYNGKDHRNVAKGNPLSFWGAWRPPTSTHLIKPLPTRLGPGRSLLRLRVTGNVPPARGKLAMSRASRAAPTVPCGVRIQERLAQVSGREHCGKTRVFRRVQAPGRHLLLC